MAPWLRTLWWLVRKGSRPRRPSLFVSVRLHLVRVWLLLGVGELWVRLWQPVSEVWWHVVGILAVVHGRLWHEAVAVHWTWLRPWRPNRLAHHIRSNPADVVS
jgi:hypothetical protein